MCVGGCECMHVCVYVCLSVCVCIHVYVQVYVDSRQTEPNKTHTTMGEREESLTCTWYDMQVH